MYLPFLKASPCLFDFALSHVGGFCSWPEMMTEYDTYSVVTDSRVCK